MEPKTAAGMAAKAQRRLEQEEVENARLADEVGRYFSSNARLRYVAPAGIGRHGGVLLLRETDDVGRLVRRLVVKYSLNEKEDDALRNEYHWLRRLRGAEHIGQLVDLDDTSLELRTLSNAPRYNDDGQDPADARNTGGGGGRSASGSGAVGQDADGQDSGRRPTLALEVISQGGWPTKYFLGIVTRACIAMDYPPDGASGAPPQRETIKPGQVPARITQNSGHMNNILISEIFPDDPEHSAAPLFKALEQLILQGMNQQPPPADQRTPVEIELGPGDPPLLTLASTQALSNLEIDGDLRLMLAACMATTAAQAATPEEVLQACEEAVATRGPAYYKGLPNGAGAYETDNALRQFFAAAVLDADTADAGVHVDVLTSAGYLPRGSAAAAAAAPLGLFPHRIGDPGGTMPLIARQMYARRPPLT